MTWPPPTLQVVVTVIALMAAFIDVRTRRIPNALTLGGAGVAFVVHGMLSGWSGLLLAGSGWATGFALFFPVFALGGMGAGDVKLLAAIGACLGPRGTLWAALYAVLAGGLMALLVSVARGYTGTAFRNLGNLLRSWVLLGVRPIDGITLKSSAGPRLPYALPIAFGAIVALWSL